VQQRLGMGYSGKSERALMRAVLVDAIQCLTGNVGGPSRRRARLSQQAREWIAEEDATWPFSFQNICHGLDLEPDRVRARVLGMAEEAGVGGRADHSRETEREMEIMIRAGHSLRTVAQRLNLTESKVRAASCGLVRLVKAERDERIRTLRRAGWTLDALAKHFGLSRGRVCRICLRRGTSAAVAAEPAVGAEARSA
jgi:DNA-binding NarL/FixJ family response regulator